jgi:hypothetical protein
MSDSTIVSAADVAAWVEAATRYPLAGSDLKARFLALAASHEALRALLLTLPRAFGSAFAFSGADLSLLDDVDRRSS